MDLAEVSSSGEVLASVPTTADKTFVVYTKIEKLAKNSNKPYGFFNHTSWRPQAEPPLPLVALTRSEWDRNQLVISSGPDPAWVDLVVNNLDEGSHPFHMVSCIV